MFVFNRTGSEFAIYPITPTGKHGRAKKLQPQDELTINARIGGVFVVENADGNVHEIHPPSTPSRMILIK